MSWLERCYQTYEYIRRAEPDLIGRQEPNRATLLPVGHTTQQAQIQVELDLDGNFLNAFVLRKKNKEKGPKKEDEQTTIIPCTEESLARTTNIAPHPLADKLQYVASNYKDFGGPKRAGWDAYHAQLVQWCNSPFSHPLVRAVLTYLEKGTLIQDLIHYNALFTDDSGLLPRTDDNPNDSKHPISSLISDQTEAFVRFRVNGIDLSNDKEIWDSFLSFYEPTITSRDYCTVLGEKTAISYLSPKKIRNDGDGTKLISHNADKGFNYTFRGRFHNTQQALSIGYRTTQEAHSALRWLISRQGTNLGDESILVWAHRMNRFPRFAMIPMISRRMPLLMILMTWRFQNLL